MLKIGITIGDPAGVGPELILKISRHFDPQKAYVIYGERKIMDAIQKEVKVGKVVELELEKETDIKTMVEKYLINPLVEEYIVE